jgi:ribonuclease BN (tRNA processing enzyme)
MKNKNIKLAVVAAFSLGLLGVSLFASREKGSPKIQSLKSDTLVVAKPADTVVSVKGKKVLYIGDSHTTYAYGWQDRLCRRTGMTYLNTAVG